MDVHYLLDRLRADPEQISTVLEALGYEPFDRGKYITCRNLDGDNQSAIVIYKEKLIYKNYTRDKSGDILTLIMDARNCSFPNALKWLAKEIGIHPNSLINYCKANNITKNDVSGSSKN